MYRTTAMMTPMTATPPITPPAITPAWLEALGALVEGVVVLETVAALGSIVGFGVLVWTVDGPAWLVAVPPSGGLGSNC